MAYSRVGIAAAIAFGFFTLTGCGSGGGTSSDPLASAAPGNSSSTPSTPTTPTQSDGGVIMFTSAAGDKPGSQNDLLEAIITEVDPTVSVVWFYNQLIPFKLTDAGGNPRTGVPVTISVYSINTLDADDILIDFLVPPVTEQTQQTVTTDSAGQGIFNAMIKIPTPPPGGSQVVSAVYKAVTHDLVPVVAYVGGMYLLKSKGP